MRMAFVIHKDNDKDDCIQMMKICDYLMLSCSVNQCDNCHGNNHYLHIYLDLIVNCPTT